MKVITEINEETFPIGEVIRLGYNCVNVGEFLWETTKHEGDRVRGRFLFSQDKGIWSDELDYLYTYTFTHTKENESYVCKGSGAEPLWSLEDYDKPRDIEGHEDFERYMMLREEEEIRWAKENN